MDAYRKLLAEYDPVIADAIAGEEHRERTGLELIPSENYAHPEVLAALGSVLTNKYAEGYPGRRYYGGQEFTDRVENVARERACELFRCEHANVQPLSGAPMNVAVYFGLLQPGDPILGMDLSHGGHLTHGSPVTHMGRIFRFTRYKSHPDQEGRIDFDEVKRLALESRPKIVLCGYSSYPRDYDYAEFKRIADAVGAIAMADVSHVGGLIAGGAMRNPFDAGFDVVTTTTHKTLRGPRGGMILCRREFAKRIDEAVFPGLQGGPHMNAVAGIAVALKKAKEPEFRAYARQVLVNAKALAASLVREGAQLVTGGTDNHLIVLHTIDTCGIDGRKAEAALDRAAMTTNKQVVPDDPNPPLRPSGVRLGSPAATARGMREAEMDSIGRLMMRALRQHDDERALAAVRAEVETLCARFPVPGL